MPLHWETLEDSMMAEVDKDVNPYFALAMLGGVLTTMGCVFAFSTLFAAESPVGPRQVPSDIYIAYGQSPSSSLDSE